MRVLITGFPTMGGSGLIATRLGEKLANMKNYDVHFLFYKTPFFLQNKSLPSNISLHLVDRPDYALFSDIGSPFTIQSASKIVEIVNTHNIDIIHSHYSIPHAVAGYLASQMTDVKTVVTTHGSDTHTLGDHHAYRSTVGHALRNASAVTSVSKFLANKTEHVFGLQGDSVEVVYNFIDYEQFTPSSGERSFNIIQASNFRPIKRIPLMIELFSEVAENFPKWNLTLVGYGPEYPVCMRRSRELDIRNRVNFLGVRKDIPELLGNASILASTSKVESFGLTIAEGMSCETPIWAPRVGGIPEICVDGKSGFLWDDDNHEEAVDTLSKLMENQELRHKFGKSGRKRIRSEFSPSKIVNDYNRIYQSII